MDIPRSNTQEFVEKLAREHGTSYVKTPCDAWADTVTRLSGDEVELDQTELLIIQLARDGLIAASDVVSLHVRYLRERGAAVKHMKHVDAIRQVLIQCLAPVSIIIFGSRGWGESTPASDIDIAVVCADGQPVTRDEIVKARMAMRQALGPDGPAIDLLMIDSKGFAASTTDPASVWYNVRRDGIPVYP